MGSDRPSSATFLLLCDRDKRALSLWGSSCSTAKWHLRHGVLGRKHRLMGVPSNEHSDTWVSLRMNKDRETETKREVTERDRETRRQGRETDSNRERCTHPTWKWGALEGRKLEGSSSSLRQGESKREDRGTQLWTRRLAAAHAQSP